MEFIGPFCREIELSNDHLTDASKIVPLQNKVLKNGVLFELVKKKSVKEVLEIATRLNPELNSVSRTGLRSKFDRLREWRKKLLAKKRADLEEEPFFYEPKNTRRSESDLKSNMVARKSSRVKKTTVVYQAPEPIHRTPKNAHLKPAPIRRSINREIELYMECVDDELSPAQLKAIKEAQKEHEKANNLIKEVRAGNILVPSSQPNTFTIVPPKQSPVAIKPSPVSKVQTPAVATVDLDNGSQRGLPPPRPAQFLSKQLQEIKKTSGTRISPDVILISDTSVAPTSSKMTVVNVPVAHMSGKPVQMQKMTNLIASPGSGAVSQQMYKFVSLPSNVPTNMVNNQFTLRPLLTVPSQQQQQLTFFGSQAIGNSSSVTATSQRQDQMPAPRSTGEELNKVGGAKLLQGQGDNQGSTVIHDTYLNSSKGSHLKNKYHSLSVNHHQWKTMHFRQCRRLHSFSYKKYSWRFRSHCERTSKLLDTGKTMQAYGRPLLTLDGLTSTFKGCLKKRKFIIRMNNFIKGSLGSSITEHNVLEPNFNSAKETKNLKISCDRPGHPSRTTLVLKHRDVKRDLKKLEAFCDNLKNDSHIQHSSTCETDLKMEVMLPFLNKETFNSYKCEERKGIVEREFECVNNDLDELSLEQADKKEVEFSLPSHVESEANDFSHSYCHCDKFEFQEECCKDLEKETVSIENDIKSQCNIVVERVGNFTEDMDEIRTPLTVNVDKRKLENSAYQDIFMESITMSKTRNRSDSKVKKVRTPFSELCNFNKIENSKTILETPVLNSKEKRNNEKNEVSYKLFDGIGKLARLAKENMSSCKQIKDIDFKGEKKRKKKRKAKSLHRLCKTLLDDYIPISSGIVYMVSESAHFMTSDSENHSFRTSDECSTVSEGKLSDITNISCGNIKINAAVAEVEGNIVDSNFNDIRENYASEMQVHECLNKLIDQVVMNEKKLTDEFILENFEPCKISKVRDCQNIVREVETQEMNCNLSALDSSREGSDKHSKLSTDFNTHDPAKKMDKGDISLERQQLSVKSDNSGSLLDINRTEDPSDTRGKVVKIDGKCNETEIKKRKWYENMTMEDELYSVLLCDQYGFTKISKDLQIPKTELLKLRRSVKKSKFFHSKVHEMSQKVENTNLPGSTFLKQGKDSMLRDDSVLKVYHPCMYKIAQTLLKTLNKSGDKFMEECSKLEDDETEQDMALQGEISKQITDSSDTADTTVDSTTVSFDESTFEINTRNKTKNKVDQIQTANVEKLSTANVEKAVTYYGRKDANEFDTMSEPGDLVIDFDSFEYQILENTNKKDKEIDNEATCKTDGLFDKYSKGAQVEAYDKLDSENDILRMECARKEKKDKKQLLCFINFDHCYENMLSKTASNQNKTEASGIELEDEDVANEDYASHIPLYDCLTYPDGTFQLYDGRLLTVYEAKSKANLVDISKHLAVFGTKCTAEHYKMPEEHVKFFLCHSLSCSINKSKSLPNLKNGIPEDYESSNHFNELSSKMFPNVISLDDYDSYDQDLPKQERLNKQDLCDRTNFAVQKTVKFNSSEESASANSDLKEKRNNGLSPKAKEVSSRVKSNNVYTKEFLDHFRRNFLLVEMDKTPSEQLILENKAAFDLIQTQYNIKTYYCNGIEKHRYTPALQRQLMLLACTVGIKAVSDYFNISCRTMIEWKKNLRKALRKYSEGGTTKVAEVKKRPKPNIMQGRKRLLLSKKLKMKLCNLCHVEGISEVCEKYNMHRKTLRRWMTELEFESLSSFELTSEDFVELIEYGEYYREHKRLVANNANTSNNKNANHKCPETETISNGEEHLSCIQNETEMVNKRDEKDNSDGSIVKEVDADQNLQMTYPNNMEVILDEDDNDQDFGPDVESDVETADSPLADNEMCNINVFETERSVETFRVDKSADANNVKDQTLKKDFLDQNASFLEAVSKEIVISDSDHEDVVEIVSWNVNNANDVEDKEDIEQPIKSENKTELNADPVTTSFQQYGKDRTLKHVQQKGVKQVETKVNQKVAAAIENKVKMRKQNKFQKVISEKEQDMKFPANEKELEMSTDMVETLNKLTCEEIGYEGLCNDNVTNENKDLVKYNAPCKLESDVNSTGKNNRLDSYSNIIEVEDDDEDIMDNMFSHEKDELAKDNSHSGDRQFQSFCSVVIKDEPFDEEFDRIEHGANNEKKISENERNKKYEKLGQNDRENKSGNDLKFDDFTTNDTNSDRREITSFKGSEINQLGTGDGNTNKAQGYTFQSTSGGTSSDSQRTGQANIQGSVPNIGLNMNSLSTENVQIVGTQDLVPGQEYILVDPRLFNSVSNSFQNLNPPSLLTPSSGAVNTVSSVRPRLQVRGLVTHVPKTCEQPTPVHIVENRSLHLGTSQNIRIGSVSPQQSNMLRPTLSTHGQQNQTNFSPRNVRSQTIRSLLTGLEVQSREVSNLSPVNNLTDQRSSLCNSVNPGRIVLQSNITSKGLVKQAQGVCESAQLVSTSSSTLVEHTSTLSTDKVNDTVLTYTLKGVGSISSKEPNRGQVVRPSTPCIITPSTSIETTSSHDSKEQEKIRKREQFSKYLPNAEMLLEKERKLLQTLLLQKSSKEESSRSLECSSKAQSKPVEKSSHVQSCNRIDSLIQKMTNRVQKRSDDAQVNLNLPVLDSNRPVTNEEEKLLKPASASEILFGEHSSPKKKEIEREPLLKSNSVKSSLFGSRSDSMNISLKKELRKSPIVMREIESSEDESSSSCSLRETSSEEETDSNVEEHGHAEGRIEQVDLSAKLKSLLSADIFNVIEPEKGDNSEGDDLIEMLAQPSCSSQNLNIDSKQKPNVASKVSANNKSQGKATALEKNASLKKSSINYSLNIKKKLGKLASMFSTVSLHKKYGVNPQTLSKWKAKYQDEEIAGLELTEEELRELEEVSKVKKAIYGSNAQEYDIYVDNPEEDEQENDTKKKSFIDQVIDKDKEENKKIVKIDENKSFASGSLEKSWLTKKIGSNKGNSEKANQNKVKMGTPLYITMDEDATDDIKQQLRRNLKIKKTVEHTWSNGAFIKSSDSSFASVFGTGNMEEAEKVAQPKTVSLNKSDNESASEREYEEVKERDNDQRRNELSKMIDQKTASSDNDTWVRTVFLCPDEGIFKYRYEKKSIKESPKTSKENQTLSVLDSLFRSQDCSSTSTDSQESVNDKSQVCSVSSESQLKETARQKFNFPSKKSDELKNKTFPENSDKDKEVYSEDFKWTVVTEARKSGFEKTAKLYGISMTDIMKWHDSFLHEKKSKELSTQKLVHNKTESSSAVVDLIHDESIQSHLIQSPVRRKVGPVNVNLSFERIQVKEGTITKPRFNSRPNNQLSTPTLPAGVVSPSNRTQRTRMGPNTIKYATPKVDPDQLQKFQADVQGDLGIMPKLMKKSSSRDGVEIASTWKQVQSVLRPDKPVERRYTQEFKQKIIAECERKGQKTVAQENRIPYNEISRWRLEAKKCSVLPSHQNSAFTKTDSSKKSDSLLSSTIMSTGSKKCLPEQGSNQPGKNEPKPGTEQESLKIKIKLSTLPQPSPSVTKKKITDQSAIQEPSSKDISKTTSPKKAAESGKTSSPGKTTVTSKAGKSDNDKTEKKQSSMFSKNRSKERSEPGQIDEDADLRMEVINFCFDQGVLKTQKKYNVTRQSIIDLMKEYDELNKYEVDNYNKSHGLHSFKTKLVSREKTSVEVTNAATQPVIVKNLNDYIVTQEYMKTVVDYALKHGITAASRKYKRKTSTVRSWMNQFQREVKKKISVEQVAKEQELIANNVSVEEARKISNLEARKKKQLLEAEFRRHIVEFARQFGITAASRRFKKKASTVKSWMGHFMKSERDAKRQEEIETRKKHTSCLDFTTSQKQIQNPFSPGRLSVASDSHIQKSPSSIRQRTPPQSPMSLWDQDFVIKPSSSKSPLKLTFSPRRKSSPIIVIGSSTEEDTIDDETNDIETDDEQENVSGGYFEVAAWNLDSSGDRSGSKQSDSSKKEESFLSKDTIENVIDLLSDEDSPENKKDNRNSLKIDKTVEKNLNASIRSSEKSLMDTTDDSLITAMDVASILDLENANDEETMKGNETAESSTTDVLLTQIKDSVETAKIENEIKEKEKNKIPYEETVMFKLMTEELDIYMKNEAVIAKYNVSKELDESKVEVKPPIVKDSSDSKRVKKFKKFADAEIMQNIEETYLFTGTRVTRNAVGKELQTSDDTFESQGNEIDDTLESQENEIIIANGEGFALKEKSPSSDKVQAQEMKDQNLQSEKNEKSGIDDNISLSENENKDISVDSPVSDNQKKGERSLFDILASESKNRKEAVDTVTKTNVVSDEKSNEMKSFNLFGNLMKSLKVEVPIDVKSPSKTENTTAVSVEIEKEQARIEKSEEFVKDRTERNVFDFICPESELPKTPTKVPSPQIQTSPRMQTRSLFRSEKALSLSPQKASPVKITPIKVTPLKKPMFKFPKLALPINFGNIAKLGMAKMKEEEKTKGDNEGKSDVSENIEKPAGKDTCSQISTEDYEVKEHVKTAIGSTEKAIGAQQDVVMETFEELRLRLSKERAANKLEKEKAKVISETESMDVDEIDGSRETGTSATAKTTIEIESEMYENFTPQKIVLILDISKKHGVEFASTSFGLPVSVIVNWIIEKDRKQRKVALSVSLEEKLKALKKMRDGEFTRDEVKEKYNLDDCAIQKWDSEISWMIEDKNVCDVLEKWKTVETVSNINFEECSKNLERRDSVVEKEVLLSEEQEKNSEMSIEKSEAVKESKEVSSSNTNDIEQHENIAEEKSQINGEAIPGMTVREEAERNEICLSQEDNVDKKETDKINFSSSDENENSEKNAVKMSENPPVVYEISTVTYASGDDNLTQMEKSYGETVKEGSSTENNLEVPTSKDNLKDVPEIISFLKTTRPRDFTIEQKAMVVLLTDKYGKQAINKKFGINTGTIYCWRHTNKHVRQYLYEQGYSFNQSKDSNNVDRGSEKTLPTSNINNSFTSTDFLPSRETRSYSVKDKSSEKTFSKSKDDSSSMDKPSIKSLPSEENLFTPADFLPSRETRSTSDKRITEALSDVNKKETMKGPTASKPEQPQKPNLQGKEQDLEKDLINHRKGYRIISPTKLPSVLNNIKGLQTKDYTLEQRVAIVKLVQLYGVRTVHKQFHISTGSIWNWQHAKGIIDVLKNEEIVENENQGAQRNIDFDVDDNDEEGPVTIDTILDRVLIAAETSSHLSLNLDQRADIVCLINHFGIDYFCEKVPQIPRGTLWNWKHNKQLLVLAENRNMMIKTYSDQVNKHQAKNGRENVVGETVDKTDLTQKWLKDVQDNIHGKRSLVNAREGSEERSKRKLDGSEVSVDVYLRKKPKLGPMCYKRSLSSDRNRRSLSPSTMCSETSVHSDDFEEIFSDDELNTSSVISKRSGTSSQTVQSNKTSKSQQRTSKGNASVKMESGLVSQSNGLVNEKTETTSAPVHEIIKFETGHCNRMMVCYKDLEKAAASTKHVRTDNQMQALKRPSPTELAASQPPAKKKTQNQKSPEDGSLSAGNWVPLDEYYYGTHEGDTCYMEEKGEYRFKCWYCSKMLYNNVRAMQHIQGHIDASKQQNIDLSDLTQCKHCYKQFDTPFEMQTHVEKVHLSNKVLMCRICEKDFSSQVQLSVHMKGNHHACEMPYVCHLCNFRSSMYSDVVDHFKKKHDSSHYMLCLYCLRTFEVKFVNQGWGQTQTYYGHLLKHQTKSATKKCVVCRLTFFNTQDVKNHRKNCHVGNYKDVKVTQGGKAEGGQKQRKGSNLKSLNAPSVSRIQDYGEIIFPAEASNNKCVECKMSMSSTDHYKKYVHCSMCRFATSCSVAYANHMMGFHSGQMSSLNLNIPWERPMKNIMYCACGFNSKYGNKIANHLVYCGKWTSYSTRRSESEALSGNAGDSKKEGSILGMLGLVQKSSVTTIEESDEIISKPKVDKKPKDVTKVEKDDEDTNEKVIATEKSDEKPIAQELADRSEEKVTEDFKDSKNNQKVIKDAVKQSDDETLSVEILKDTSHDEKESADTHKEVKDTQKENVIKAAEIIELDSDEESTESLKKEEEESDNTKNENDSVTAKVETKEEIDTVAADVESEKEIGDVTEENYVSPSVNEEKQTQEDKEVMDQNEPDVKTKSEPDGKSGKEEKEFASNLKEVDVIDNTDGQLENKDTSFKEEMETQTDLKAEDPNKTLEKIEEMETVDEVEKEMEQEASVEASKEGGKKLSETDEEITSKDKEKSVSETESKDTVENVPDDEEMVEEVEENVADTEVNFVEGQSEEKETEVFQQEQELAESSDVKDTSSTEKGENEPKEDKTPKEGNEAKMQEKVEEVESLPQKESEDKDKREKSMERASSSDRRSSSDRHSQERRRDSSERHSSERQSQERRRDSSERHSSEKRESAERHHSGSRDSRERSKYDDWSRHDDRHRQDSRSYGANRSDSHHGNRSSYDQNRDRSYNRDRDYRSRDHRERHNDGRSGHGYQDNRSYGGQSHRDHQGQYGGYQGNRGGHNQDRNRGSNNQDRNYNRNYNQNRGGYNQNYRGNYRGGYY